MKAKKWWRLYTTVFPHLEFSLAVRTSHISLILNVSLTFAKRCGRRDSARTSLLRHSTSISTSFIVAVSSAIEFASSKAKRLLARGCARDSTAAAVAAAPTHSSAAAVFPSPRRFVDEIVAVL